MGTSPTPGSCIHRRHLRLESLRTLILADNKLTRLSLYLDDTDFSMVTEVDENEVSDYNKKMCPILHDLQINVNVFLSHICSCKYYLYVKKERMISTEEYKYMINNEAL